MSPQTNVPRGEMFSDPFLMMVFPSHLRWLLALFPGTSRLLPTQRAKGRAMDKGRDEWRGPGCGFFCRADSGRPHQGGIRSVC